MVTARRSSNLVNNTFETSATQNASVAILERPEVSTIKEEVASKTQMTESQLEEAKARRKNLDMLLNYDRYAEQSAVQEQAVEQVLDEIQITAQSLSEEDIRPTSTTMQFGDDIDSIREEMRQGRNEEKVSYKLNSRGKFVIALYSIAVTVILALIIMNTGMLAKLSNISQTKSAELASTVQEYNAVVAEIENISDADHIISVAQNDFGMVKGN